MLLQDRWPSDNIYCTYVIQEVESIFDKVTSWSQLISKLMPVSNVASHWPCTFLHPRFSISLNKYHYFVEVYKQMLL